MHMYASPGNTLGSLLFPSLWHTWEQQMTVQCCTFHVVTALSIMCILDHIYSVFSFTQIIPLSHAVPILTMSSFVFLFIFLWQSPATHVAHLCTESICSLLCNIHFTCSGCLLSSTALLSIKSDISILSTSKLLEAGSIMNFIHFQDKIVTQ